MRSIARPHGAHGVAIVAALLLGGGAALAQPKQQPPPRPPENPSGDKLDAKSLMQSGLRLLAVKDYLGALAVFKDAYARFPNTKILLNIGTTLRLLERNADAANAYQRYLDSPEADPAKKGEVAAAIAELDRTVGQLEISVTPADAQVQINDEDWQPADAVKRHRVVQGQFTVRARKDKFQAEAKSALIVAGEKAGIQIALTALPEAPKVIQQPSNGGGRDMGIRAAIDPDAPRSRIGALALLHIDAPRAGGAALLGLTVDVIPRLQIQGAAIVGPFYGGYVGTTFAILPGAFRPTVAGGLAIFSSDGARYALRGAGGLELLLSRHVSLIAELGVEYVINEQITTELNIKKTVFVPAVGASGRL